MCNDDLNAGYYFEIIYQLADLTSVAEAVATPAITRFFQRCTSDTKVIGLNSNMVLLLICVSFRIICPLKMIFLLLIRTCHHCLFLFVIQHSHMLVRILE